MDAKKIIDVLGGLTKASSILDIPVSTLQYWRDTNRIPERQIDYVIKTAKKNGVLIVYEPS